MHVFCKACLLYANVLDASQVKKKGKSVKRMTSKTRNALNIITV